MSVQKGQLGSSLIDKGGKVASPTRLNLKPSADKPQPAASVILLRPVESTGFEVFLTRRPAEIASLGGMYRFPGGKVRPEDYSPFMLTRCRGLSPDAARRMIGTHFTAQEAVAFWLAAIRELFEETGVLLAVDEADRPFSARPEHKAEPGEKRAPLTAAVTNFQRLLETETLFCDVGRLLYFSHWQIAARLAKRLDTRFFLAVLPQGQHPRAAAEEAEHTLWLTPDRALRLFHHGQLPMIFPTFASLRTLADFDTLESVLREFTMRAGQRDY